MKKIILLSVTVLGFLTSLPTTCKAGFGDLGPYFSFTWGDGGNIPADVNVTGQQTSPDGQNVTLSGQLATISGANFADGFVLYWSGDFQGPINPGDSFTAGLNFGVTTTGGTLTWSFYGNLWSNEGYEQARILTGLAPVPASGQVSGVQLASSQFTQPGETGLFEGYLNIEWSGYSPTDTFSINVNSIDITYVPEPGLMPLAIALSLLLPVLDRRTRARLHFAPTK